MFIRKFLGWEEASLQEYKNCHLRYGGNFETHPDILNFIHGRADCKEKFYVHHTAGNINGSVCVWGNKHLANDITPFTPVNELCLPLARDELILPVEKNRKMVIPWKSKILSPVQKNIINSSEFFNACRSLCLAKTLDEFSKKTVQIRNREIKSFINEGGEIRDQSELSASVLFEIYDNLFEKRRGLRIDKKENVIDFIHNFRNNIFGKLLYLEGNPCAFQLITKCESLNINSFNFINIGIDKEIKELPLGTILMWININEACKTLENENQQMRFSFGRPTAEYKNRWCYQEKLSRLL
ncbi:hypothetical protein BTJ39_12170 [Izhakiella australiensis]|uniref:Mig-14 family protein n=1 Tax=Izhakiella australiensis TaxID=1926881 RepID=A0A1S8YLG8_9GAMM|nr:hypothetical protein [Izhakiella australiensis]OON39782.1 hypothetical protein BTJ39_12170 [Izhakiella australiensis]